MDASKEKLVRWLFETKAVRVCPQDKPFWYTSGTIGPYYINTHFLYGSEEKAEELLKTIDFIKSDKYGCPLKLLELTRRNYEQDPVFKGLMDEMLDFIKKNIRVNEIDYVSGGERRDWFFSFLIADFLNKPHITIYKDMSVVVTEGNKVHKDTLEIPGKKVLHIADLVTEASSYERAWIPAIENMKGTISWSVVVVDRKQGGGEFMKSRDINLFPMVSVDNSLFDLARTLGLINDTQHQMILDYIKNPKEAMRQFLLNHPEFLKNALNGDEKTKERARLCLEKNFYDIVVG